MFPDWLPVVSATGFSPDNNSYEYPAGTENGAIDPIAEVSYTSSSTETSWRLPPIVNARWLIFLLVPGITNGGRDGTLITGCVATTAGAAWGAAAGAAGAMVTGAGAAALVSRALKSFSSSCGNIA